jgi:hypothetical protein
MKLDIAYTDEYLKYKLGAGDGSHMTKPIRAAIATRLIVDELGAESVQIIEPTVGQLPSHRLQFVQGCDGWCGQRFAAQKDLRAGLAKPQGTLPGNVLNAKEVIPGVQSPWCSLFIFGQ